MKYSNQTLIEYCNSYNIQLLANYENTNIVGDGQSKCNLYNEKLLEQKDNIDSFNEFLFKQTFPLEIKENKLIFLVKKPLLKLIPLFKDKYKELFELDVEVVEVEKQENQIKNP